MRARPMHIGPAKRRIPAAGRPDAGPICLNRGVAALYRKYRPQIFAEVVGQEAVVRTLSNAIETGKVRQAYLFAGPRGTGKTSLARILAKSRQLPASGRRPRPTTPATPASRSPTAPRST